MNRKLLYLLVAALPCAAAGCWLSDAGGDPLQQLARMQPRRSFAPRLSIPTEYHPCKAVPVDSTGSVPREECGTRDEDSPDLGAFRRAGGSIDPDSLQGTALAALIWWDRKEPSLDDAIARLEKALRLSRNPVPLLVDASAAHLLRAERTDNPPDLLKALEFAYRALAREPRNGPARFNAALALQAFGLDEQAALEWRAFLSTDSTSEWAREAQSRMGRLILRPVPIATPALNDSATVVTEFAGAYPLEARKFGMDSVLGAWGEAVEGRNHPRADSLLSMAEVLGSALKLRSGGDASLADAVEAIRVASPDGVARLARAHRAYAEGQAYLAAADGPEAMAAFTRAVEARPASRMLLQWSSISQAALLVYLSRPDQAEKDLRARLPGVDGGRYPALEGRARVSMATALGRGGKFNEGREYLRQAMDCFARAGEDALIADVLSLDAEFAYQFGNVEGAYRSAHRALQAHHRTPSPAGLHKLLIALGRFAEQDEMPYAAWAIYNEDVARAGLSPRPIDVLQVHAARAGVRAAVRDSLGARNDVAYAALWVPRLPPNQTQAPWVRSTLLLARPEGVTPAQMDSAVNAFAENVVWLAPVLTRRVELRLAEDDVPGATADLQTLTEGVRRLTGQEANPVFRAAIIEEARSLFDQLVMLQVRDSQPEEALRTLERGRMSFAPRRPGEVAPGEGRTAAPPGHVAVEYALIRDTLFIWTIDTATIRLQVRPLDRDAFLLAVEQANAALEAGAPIPTVALRKLYDWLIRPIQGDLGPPETPLVILADGEVARVPFAALMDGERYLMERHPLRLAATLQDAARPAPRGSGPVLLVADPAFDRIYNAPLERLPGAREEVALLAGMFGNPLRLEDENATRDSFVATAPLASIIHYAGHAVFDDVRPERSYLLLAGADTTGRLTAEAVTDTLRLDGVRLVVLSACSTVRSRAGRTGGFAGFSGALLNAGAGGVVGSLWRVDDERTRPLMEAFHRRYTQMRDPARALRAAQLDMLRSNDPELRSPATWAGFRYMGS